MLSAGLRAFGLGLGVRFPCCFVPFPPPLPQSYRDATWGGCSTGEAAASLMVGRCAVSGERRRGAFLGGGGRKRGGGSLEGWRNAGAVAATRKRGLCPPAWSGDIRVGSLPGTRMMQLLCTFQGESEEAESSPAKMYSVQGQNKARSSRSLRFRALKGGVMWWGKTFD